MFNLPAYKLQLSIQILYSMNLCIILNVKKKTSFVYQDYLKELYRRYAGDPDEAPPAPELPEWCFEVSN